MVDDTTEESSPLDLTFLGNMEAVGSPAVWRAELLLLGYSVPFKLDTGAGVTTISEQIYDQLPANYVLLGGVWWAREIIPWMF